MKSDILLKEDVEQELEWELGKKAAEVGVAVKDGVVVLNGYMESYADKWAAERAVKRVSGVTAAANEIEVKLPNSSQRSDLDIARAAQNALEWNAVVPHDRIEVVVEMVGSPWKERWNRNTREMPPNGPYAICSV